MQYKVLGREWAVERLDAPSPGAPLILLLSGQEALTAPLKDALEAAGVPPLWLALPQAVDWDRDYTPWPAEGSGGRTFAGKASGLRDSVPALLDGLRAEADFGPVYPVGYSLGGLAALWLHAELGLDGAGSCSGSLWYPGFTEYLSAHPPAGKVYLSLGGKEKNTRDPLMAGNPAATERTLQICRFSAARAVFRAEPGGHFRDPEGRAARAIRWLCA